MDAASTQMPSQQTKFKKSMYEVTTHTVSDPLVPYLQSLYLFTIALLQQPRARDRTRHHTSTALRTSHFLSWGFLHHSPEGLQQESNHPF